MASRNVTSEIAGKVWQVERAPGDKVGAEDPILILESMKMEIPVLAPVAGTIRSIEVGPEDNVIEGQVVAIIDL